RAGPRHRRNACRRRRGTPRARDHREAAAALSGRSRGRLRTRAKPSIGAARLPWHFAGMADTAVHQDLPLAAEFPVTDRAEWVRLVEKALKDRPFEKLVSRTYDGITVEPLYPRAANASAVAGRAPGAPWTVMQRIDHPDAAAADAETLHDLANGADGLTRVLADAPSAH